MRSQNFIFILVLLTLNVTNTFDFSSFVELGDLKSDPYGKSLIETISMSMANAPGGKIENIENLLNDLLMKLINDQKKEDENWRKEKATLENRSISLQLEISKFKTEITGLKKEKAILETKKLYAENNIIQYKAQDISNKNSVKDVAIRRKRDKANYDASVKEHSAIIGAIEQVVVALSKLKGNIAGIKRPSHVETISSEERSASFKHAKKSFLEIVDDEEANAFLELATEEDQSGLEKLVALLRNLANNSKKSLADDEDIENKSSNSFKKLRTNLESDSLCLEDLLKRQNLNLEQFRKSINELSLTTGIRESLRKSRENELKSTREEIRAKEEKYKSGTAHRKREETVINRVKKIVKERLARMSQFLKPNVNKF